MRVIRRYPDGKLYDMEEKKYTSLKMLTEIHDKGEKFTVKSSDTGEEVTAEILDKLEKKAGTVSGETDDVKKDIIRKLKKRGEALGDYGKKYVSFWQKELDRFVRMITKDENIPETEVKKITSEMQNYVENIRSWISERVDQGVNDAMSRMNLASRDQVHLLTREVESLNKKIEKLNKLLTK